MENGIKNKLDLFESGRVPEHEMIHFLFEYRDDWYFKSSQGNNRLKRIFNSEINLNLKCVLIYLILNYEDLDDSWHKRLADFALKNITLLNDTKTLPSLVVNRDILIYEYLTTRIFNSNYLKSKKWIYVLSLPYDTNKSLVGRVLKDIEAGAIPFSSFLPYPISKNLAQSLIKKYNDE